MENKPKRAETHGVSALFFKKIPARISPDGEKSQPLAASYFRRKETSASTPSLGMAL